MEGGREREDGDEKEHGTSEPENQRTREPEKQRTRTKGSFSGGAFTWMRLHYSRHPDGTATGTETGLTPIMLTGTRVRLMNRIVDCMYGVQYLPSSFIPLRRYRTRVLPTPYFLLLTPYSIRTFSDCRVKLIPSSEHRRRGSVAAIGTGPGTSIGSSSSSRDAHPGWLNMRWVLGCVWHALGCAGMRKSSQQIRKSLQQPLIHFRGCGSRGHLSVWAIVWHITVLLSAGCWVLGAGCWVLGAGCWVYVLYVCTVYTHTYSHPGPDRLGLTAVAGVVTTRVWPERPACLQVLKV